MAEGKGFEPPKGISSFNDLANRRLQPLGHPSAGAGPSVVQMHPSDRRRYTAYAGRIPSFECAACQTGNDRAVEFTGHPVDAACPSRRAWPAEAG